MRAMLAATPLRRFTRWVLLAFVLSLGAAIASPLIQPQAVSLICSGMGVMKVIVQTDDGMVELGSHALDCPLCANLAAPPPVALLLAQPKPGLVTTPQATPTPHLPGQPDAPWQARAPPAFS